MVKTRIVQANQTQSRAKADNLTNRPGAAEIYHKGDKSVRLPSLGNRDLIKKTPYTEDSGALGVPKGSAAWQSIAASTNRGTFKKAGIQGSPPRIKQTSSRS